MSAEIVDQTGGVVTFRISGKLKQAEMAGAQAQAAGIIQKQGKVSFLVLIENFLGTEKEGDWGDVSFQFQNDDFIKKIALVGDKQWEALTLMFTGKGIRRVAIEYFTDLAKARAWLAA
jgi:hypothetical protein